MTDWQPIETAPKDGAAFLVAQEGEVYRARYDELGRIMWRTHGRLEPRSFRVMPVEIDGVTETRNVLTSEGPDEFRHDWCFWTRLFDFKPTHWMPLPAPPAPQEQGEE